MTDQPSDPGSPPIQRSKGAGSILPAVRSSTAMLGFLGGLVGGLLAAAIVVVVLAGSWPMLRARLLPPAETKSVAIDELVRRVTVLEQSAARPAQPDPATAQLSQRIGALEQAPRVPAEDPRVAALTTKTDQLAEQVAALHAASGDSAEMEQKVERAEAAAKSAQDAAARRQSAEALLMVAGQLRDAVERGGPYAIELAAARKVAPAATGAALDALAPEADRGVERRATLVDDFAPVAAAIGRAALVPAEGDDIWSRLKREAAKLVIVRRVDSEGDDPMSIAARAEKALKAGDLAGAVKTLQALGGEPADAAKAWIARAQQRLAAERGLADLAASTSVALSASD